MLPIDTYVKYDINAPIVDGHKASVLDFDFSPFKSSLLASASEDCTVKVWTIPEGGLKSTLTEASSSLIGHVRRVYSIRFHPSVNNLLCSVSADGCSKLWDVECSKSITSSKCLYDQTYHDLVWNSTGSRYMVSSKSQNIHFIDARTSEVSALVSKAHDGGKSIKLASLCDGSERLLSAGTGKGSLRQCKIWDPRNLSTEVCKVDVDNASGTLMPFYDRDTGLLYLGGKGDANIRYYEIPYNGSDIHLISDFKSNIATKGLAMVPKRSLDVMSCEINRFLKLTSNSIEPISFYVPRKSTSFQDDLYPDVYGDVAAHTIEEWLSGSDAMPHKISLRPPDAGKPGSGRSPRAEEFEFVKSRPSSDLPALDDSNVRREEELLSEIRRAKMRIFGLENRLRKSGLSAI